MDDYGRINECVDRTDDFSGRHMRELRSRFIQLFKQLELIITKTNKE